MQRTSTRLRVSACRGRRPFGCTIAFSVLAVVALFIAGCGGSSSSTGSTGGAESKEGGEATPSGTSSFVTEAEKQVQVDYKGRFTKPPATAPPHKSGVNIWLISCGEASQGCSEPIASAKRAAEALGWKPTVFDGNFGIGDAYNNGIRQAVSAGAEAILTFAVDCNSAKSGYEAAKAAGIPVVGVDSFDCSDPQIKDGPSLFSAETEFTPEITSAAEMSEAKGQARADWIIAHTNGEAKVIDTAFTAVASGTYENIGFVKEMEKCTSCTIVKTIDFAPPDISNGVLKQAWSSALAQYPEANAGVNSSDGIIIPAGMAQAVQSAGRTKTFALVGGEGYSPNIELIRDENGESAVVPWDSNWLIWGGIDTVVRVLAGKKAVPEGMGIQLVDKEHNLPSPGDSYKAPVDFEKLYEEAWGVR